MKTFPQSALDVLHRITLSSSDESVIADHHSYLTWFLKTCFALFTEEDKLLYANMHYFSPLLQDAKNATTGWLAGIPTLLDLRNDAGSQAPNIIRNVMAFLGAIFAMVGQGQEGAAISMETFRDKFLINNLRARTDDPIARPFVFDPRTRLLDFHIPNFYNANMINSHFERIDLHAIDLIQEETPGQFAILDGFQFEATVARLMQSPNGQAFLAAVRQFFADSNIQHHISGFRKQLTVTCRKLSLTIDASAYENLLHLAFLHSLLKSNRHTYMIPAASLGNADNPPSFGAFLIATEAAMPVYRLNLLHIALNLAFGVLRDIERRAASPPSPRVAPKATEAPPQQISPRRAAARPTASWQENLFCGMVGRSPAMRALFQKIRSVARFDTDVMILGESGVGKELVARALHDLSPRAKGPFIEVSLAERSETIIASELFGHEKAAFTGAVEQHRGFFERASRGTLFLDEIAQIPVDVQSRLLRVLETRKISRLGGREMIATDVRIISATSENLRNQEIRDKIRFQHQLYYRLEKFIIEIPPLRERRDDIALLAEFFLYQLDKQGKAHIHPEALARLLAYGWPGNVRELCNEIQRAYINAYDEQEIRPEHLEIAPTDSAASRMPDLPEPEFTVLLALRKTAFGIDAAQRLLVQTQPFHPDRRTLMRNCRELCLWFLAQNDWNISLALREMAGTEDLQRAAARKFHDYFIGDKTGTGIFQYLSRGDELSARALSAHGLVRKRYEILLDEFVEKYQSGVIGIAHWQHVLQQLLE